MDLWYLVQESLNTNYRRDDWARINQDYAAQQQAQLLIDQNTQFRIEEENLKIAEQNAFWARNATERAAEKALTCAIKLERERLDYTQYRRDLDPVSAGERILETVLI